MKSPFRQQVSEYDCVPTTFLNAICYLFERSEIPPFVVQRIYLLCLDKVPSHKAIGHGTSGFAVQLLGEWLNEYKHIKFRVQAEYRKGDSVNLNRISSWLKAGGVALLRVKDKSDDWHYILALSMSDGWVYCYDPYTRMPKSHKSDGYEFIVEKGLHAPNLRITCSQFDKNSNLNKYRFGSLSERECLLLKRAEV